MRLATYEDVWLFSPDLCPCDAELLEALALMQVRGKTLFHFGTGQHHLVGRSLPASRNTVLAVTASQGEYEAYMDLVTNDAEIATFYKAMFCDIYTMSANMLPMFDLVTLFHLCKYYHPSRNAYSPLNDETLLALMISRTMPNGRLVFYSGSDGFAQTLPLIEAAERRGAITRAEQHKHLLFYQPVS
jgi:hypothetical protein